MWNEYGKIEIVNQYLALSPKDKRFGHSHNAVYRMVSFKITLNDHS